jgi:phosphoenolpyruvate carboxylase
VDDVLRADIRLLTTLLGQTLVRSEGQDLLDLVEMVRGQAKVGGLSDLPSEVDARLREMDLPTTIKVVRAFTSYFHLANVTEQVHRGRTLLRKRESGGGWLEWAVARIVDAGVPTDVVSEAVGRLAVRPVLTAHPTEAARRSILDKLRRVADLLDSADTGPRRRRLAGQSNCYGTQTNSGSLDPIRWTKRATASTTSKAWAARRLATCWTSCANSWPVSACGCRRPRAR